jgi:hypothetical protein
MDDNDKTSSDMRKKQPAKSFSNRFLKTRHSFSNAQLLSFIAVFALIGGIILLRSFASTNPTDLLLRHTEGALVRASGTQDVYMISGGQRHLVTLDDFRSGRYDYTKTLPAVPGDETLPVGDPVPLPPGIFIQDNHTGEYFVTDLTTNGQNVRRPISSSAMSALGYSPADALKVSEVPPILGSALTASSAHPIGSLIQDTNQTYVVNAGQLQPISDAVKTSRNFTWTRTSSTAGSVSKTSQPKITTETTNFTWSKPLPATAADKAMAKGPALNYPSGTLLQGSDPNKIFLVDNSSGIPAKRLIRDKIVLTNLGYVMSDVIKVADSQLPVNNGNAVPEDPNSAVSFEAVLKKGYDGSQIAKNLGSPTTIRHAYSQWIAGTTPLSNLANLKANPAISYLIGDGFNAKPAYQNCNDTGSGPPVPCPELNYFTADKTSVPVGSTVQLSWASANATSCTAGGGWSGQKGTGGSETTGALTASTTFSLYCSGAGYNTSTLYVTVSVTSSSGGGGGGSITNTAAPVISGTLAVGSTLTVNNGSWNGGPTSFSYQWQRCTDQPQTGGPCTNITTQTNSTYTIQSGDVDHYLQAKVTATNGSSSATATSNATDFVPNPNGSGGGSCGVGCTAQGVTNTLPPSISGTLQVGKVLTSTKGNWTGNPVSYAYQWYRCPPGSAGSHTVCNPISGASAASYTLVSADSGNQMQVAVIATSSLNNKVTAYSAETSVVQAGSGTAMACDGTAGVYLYSATNYTGNCSKFPASSSAASTWTVGNDKASSIKIVGGYTATLYQDNNYSGTYSMFSLNHASLAGYDVGNGTTSSIQITNGAMAKPYASGCPTTGAAGVYVYAATGYKGTCQYFNGSSQSPESWSIGDNNLRSVKVVGSYTVTLFTTANFGGAWYQTGVSQPDVTQFVVKQNTSSITLSNSPNIPQPLNPPTITGNPVVGTTLTTDNGTWATSGFHITYPQPTSFAYQWYRCTSKDQNGQYCYPGKEIAIGGATGKTYTLTKDDAGGWVSVTVYGKAKSGTGINEALAYGPITGSGTPPPTTGAPTVKLSAATNTISTLGESVALLWSSTNAKYCQGSQGTSQWQVQLPANQGSPGFQSGPLSKTSTTFVITCYSSTGATATDSTTITLSGSNGGGSGIAAHSPGLAAIGWTAGSAGAVGVLSASGISDVTGLGVDHSDSTNSCGHGSGDTSHDTMVSQFIGLSGDGINTPVGVAPGTRIYELSFGGDFDSDAACEVQWALSKGISIIDLSYEVQSSDTNASCYDNSGNVLSGVSSLHLTICNASNLRFVNSAGNEAVDDSKWIAGTWQGIIDITGAQESNGYSPNSPNSATAPKSGGPCSVTNDDAGIGTFAWSGHVHAAPLCVWMGNSGYPSGTSFAAPMAAAVLGRGGSLSGGGSVQSPNGHSYGTEIHL